MRPLPDFNFKLVPGHAFGPSLLLTVCLVIFPDALARAESAMMFQSGSEFEKIAATTFDTEGIAVGESAFWVEDFDSNQVTMKIELAIEGGGVNRSQATFQRIDSGLTISALPPVSARRGAQTPIGQRKIGSKATRENGKASSADSKSSTGLRLIEQRAEATRADGTSLPLLVIDHVAKTASCIPQGDEPGMAKEIELPEQDRVVNVPLQLLFEPLVAGDEEKIQFQLIICRKGPVLYDMVAKRGGSETVRSNEVLAIEYGPDVGRALGWMAKSVLPRFHFWFNATGGKYMGHRMPLHAKGPEVLLVRQGLGPSDLGLSND